jgi:EmrB/QacA subfamily drug resistance transporter
MAAGRGRTPAGFGASSYDRGVVSDRAAASVPDRRSVLVVFSGLVLVMLMAALDSTIVSTALPTIVGDLGGLNHISWVVTAYLLASTAVTPLYGKLGDQFGRKVVLQIAMVVFLVGSALCGLSQSLTILIVFRAIQGLGGGGLIVGAQAAIGDVVPPRERGRYMGIFGGVFGFASVIGPLLGGFFTSTLSWRWIFYVNLPIGIAAFAVLAVTLPSATERVHHTIDYLGTGLLALGLSALVLMCTLGGTSFSWGSPVIIGLGVGAVVLMAAFVRAERAAAEPVLPPRLFKNQVFTVTSGIGFVVGFALFGSVTYLPLFLQVVNGATPTTSGLEILPLMAGLLITSIGSGQLITRTGRYKPFPIIGTAVMVVGLALLSTMSSTTSRLTASLFMFVLGLGLGSVMQVLVLAVQNAVEYKDLGVATSGATLFRSIGGSIGTAILGSVFSSRLSAELSTLLGHAGPAAAGAGAAGVSPGAAAGRLAHANPASLSRLPAALHDVYITAFTNALGTVFVVAAFVAAAAFLLSWVLPQLPLRESVAAGSGIGETFAVPKHTDSQAEIARALSVLVGREGRRRMVEQWAQRAGVSLTPAECWVLVRSHFDPDADLEQLATDWQVPLPVATDALETLIQQGLLTVSDNGSRTPSAEGEAIAERLIAERRASLARLLEGWSPEQHAEIATLLTRFAHELAAEPEPEVAMAEVGA